jgi:putative transcriptional regulator
MAPRKKSAHSDLGAYFRTRGSKVRPVDVAAIRAITGLSQQEFVKACGISVHTLRNWEQGRRSPRGPARALLLAIARDPLGVIRALQG